jgi:hypothetical protein
VLSYKMAGYEANPSIILMVIFEPRIKISMQNNLHYYISKVSLISPVAIVGRRSELRGGPHPFGQKG